MMADIIETQTMKKETAKTEYARRNQALWMVKKMLEGATDDQDLLRRAKAARDQLSQFTETELQDSLDL